MPPPHPENTQATTDRLTGRQTDQDKQRQTDGDNLTKTGIHFRLSKVPRPKRGRKVSESARLGYISKGFLSNFRSHEFGQRETRTEADRRRQTGIDRQTETDRYRKPEQAETDRLSELVWKPRACEWFCEYNLAQTA